MPVDLQQMEATIKALQEGVEKTKAARSQAQGRKESLEQQQSQILAEFQALGVDPDQAEAVIQRLEQQLAEGVKAAADLIPWEFLGMTRPTGV